MQWKANLELQNAKHHLFDEDNPEEAKVEKPATLLSFSNVNEGKKNINKHKNLKNK
jgi:hypothetical protein